MLVTIRSHCSRVTSCGAGDLAALGLPPTARLVLGARDRARRATATVPL